VKIRRRCNLKKQMFKISTLDFSPHHPILQVCPSDLNERTVVFLSRTNQAQYSFHSKHNIHIQKTGVKVRILGIAYWKGFILES
jgi:hypothetical protein